MDPENFPAEVHCALTPAQAEAADARVGVLRLFSPANPTGRYCLRLAHQTQYMVAVRLMELYQQQVGIARLS